MWPLYVPINAESTSILSFPTIWHAAIYAIFVLSIGAFMFKKVADWGDKMEK